MDKYRGHKIEELSPGYWIYADRGIPVSWWKDRPCGYCGLANTAEGHDGCLGILPDVMNACCGHGEDNSAYVQFKDGESVHGEEAVRLQNKLCESEEPE